MSQDTTMFIGFGAIVRIISVFLAIKNIRDLKKTLRCGTLNISSCSGSAEP
jgi:hypothetical protein